MSVSDTDVRPPAQASDPGKGDPALLPGSHALKGLSLALHQLHMYSQGQGDMPTQDFILFLGILWGPRIPELPAQGSQLLPGPVQASP